MSLTLRICTAAILGLILINPTRLLAHDPTPDPRCGGWSDCDLPGTPPNGEGGSLRDRTFQITSVPHFRTGGSGDQTATWLELGEVAVMWDWKDTREPGTKWTNPALADVVRLEPQTEYTFELVTLGDCDEIDLDYGFKADRVFLLRVLKEGNVVFDAHARARVREAKSSIPIAKVSTADEALTRVTKDILHAKALSESDAGFNWAVSGTFKAAAPDVVVLIEQPMYENSVVVLVYDPSVRTREAIEATAFEANCPNEFIWPGKAVTLRQVRKDSAIFTGRAAIEGAHGTVVKVQYEHRDAGGTEKMLLESNQIGMTFH